MLENVIYWLILGPLSFAAGHFLAKAALLSWSICRDSKDRRLKAAADKKMFTDEYFIVPGPIGAHHAVPILLPNGFPILVQGPIADGDEIHVDRNSGELTLHHKADRNLTMDHGSFSLDELEQAKEYLNSGGKLH